MSSRTRLFISHAHRDVDRADQLAEALTAVGYDVFIDRQLRSGQDFEERLVAELDAADQVIVIWTKHSVRSAWVEREARHALGKLLPVRVQVPPPSGFEHLHTPNVRLMATGHETAVVLGLVEPPLPEPDPPRWF